MRSCETQSSQLRRMSAKVLGFMVQIYAVALASRGAWAKKMKHEKLL